jgi:hypothetical protein
MAAPALTALLDQVDAASRQVRTGLRAIADGGGFQLGAGDEWAREVVDDLLDRALTRRLRACPHITSPQPVVTAAWRRNLITCWACARLVFDISSDPIADATCDACGRYTAGRIHPGMVAAGPLMILVGRCGRCKPGGGTS